MNAQLKPIEAVAVTRPAYDNANVAKGGIWISNNYQRLQDYYVALGGRMPDPLSKDNVREFARAQKFMSFCTVQWDRERMAL